MLQLLDADGLRRWVAQCVQDLTTHCAEINALNVFPVADSDTGTNLLHTLGAGLQALEGMSVESSRSYPEAAAALARGAVLGARGNSGVIISQVLRGLAETSPLAEGSAAEGSAAAGLAAAGLAAAGLDAAGFCAALRRAGELALDAVSDPVDGTILTVLRAAADAADTDGATTLAAVGTAAARGAAEALLHTPAQLAVLARAGVVDAGGRGLVVILDALVTVVSGSKATPREHSVAVRPAAALIAQREGGSGQHAYEVMYLLDETSAVRVQQLRAELNRLGDSVVIVEDGDGLHSVHVHCSDVGAAVETGVVAGRPHRITVVRFAETVEPAVGAGGLTREPALLAFVEGSGAAELFAAEGAAVLRCDGLKLDDEAVRAAIEGAGSGHVTLLPNGLVAPAALSEVVAEIRRAGQGVTLLPTSSPVQGLAALAVHDPTRDSEDDTLAMAEAATAARRGAVRIASEQALTWVGRCEPGEVLGLVDDEVVLLARGDNEKEWQSDVARGLLDRMLDAGGELVTVLTGVAMEDGLAEQMQEHVRAVHPGVELVVYSGDLPADVLVLGVE